MAGATPCGAVSASLAPPVIEKEARPGQQIGDTISYTNNGDEPVVVSVSVVDFDVNDAYDILEQPPGTAPTTLAPYIRVAPTEVRVPPKQQVFFRYSVRTPQVFMHLRGMVFFLTRPEIPKTGQAQVTVASRMGVPLYVESAAATPARLRVDNLEWERSGDAGSSLRLKLAITNEGGRLIRPTGYLEVRSADGHFHKVFAFNEGKLPVFPDSARRLEMGFGPVPGGELFLRLRFDDSSRTQFKSESRLPAPSG
jgi:P pilus assembly chaperone PapD